MVLGPGADDGASPEVKEGPGSRPLRLDKTTEVWILVLKAISLR